MTGVKMTDTVKILPKPSPLCNGCKLYEEQCHCLCHKSPMFGGFHEIAWDEMQEIKVRHPEDD